MCMPKGYGSDLPLITRGPVYFISEIKLHPILVWHLLFGSLFLHLYLFLILLIPTSKVQYLELHDAADALYQIYYSVLILNCNKKLSVF